MQGLRTLLILASFCFLETAASQAAAGALTGLSRGGTGAPVPDGRGPGSSAGSHVTAETKAPLDSIVLTNQAGLSWALQNFDKGWALGTISLHGKPVEAQASNGMLILHNVITGEQRWIPASKAQRAGPRACKLSGGTRIDRVTFTFVMDIALRDDLPAAIMNRSWSVDKDLNGWEVSLAYHDTFAYPWRCQMYSHGGNSASLALQRGAYTGVPGPQI